MPVKGDKHATTVRSTLSVDLLWIVILIAVAPGCSTGKDGAAAVEQPHSAVIELCENGDYHSAMRELPASMAQWTEYTRATGRTCEGAAGYEYGRTMFSVAQHGDAHWGRILDDPDIPYAYKTEMIFEILEARLGKGAVYVANDDNLIVPRHGVIDLDEEMISLPD